MLIEKQYIQELLDLVQREQAIGNTWVAYTQEPYPDKSIHFFKHEAEVKNFCIEATKDGGNSETKPLYFIRKTEDLNLAVLKELEYRRKYGDLSDLHVIGLPVDYNVKAITVKGIYLPDLKRVIDDSLWHEYKDMGLDWGNRHESWWWELNGSFTVDRIDRDVSILLDDKRTKNIVEQLIGKVYLSYFDRSLLFTDEQRAKIESQLVDYPFAELNDPKRKQEIIESLGKGNSSWMTLEKGFYPEPEIGQYIVFEHLYPKGMVYEHGHSIRELSSFPGFSMALEFLQIYGPIHFRIPNERVSELLLIGQYQDKKLLFNYDGLPENHTGLHIATGWKNGNNLHELIFNHLPHEPILLKESFFVCLDIAGVIRFNDGVNEREIDLSFWKPAGENVNPNIATQRDQLRLTFTTELMEQYFSAINSNLKYTTMNVENAQFVNKQVYYKMGRDNQYENDINTNMESGVEKFSAKGKYEFYEGERKLETELNFKRGGKDENYFWNSYDATLTSATGQVTKQRFYIDTLRKENAQGKWEVKTLGFAPKEACNLLDSDHIGNSRAVNKEFYNREGIAYTAWYKLDLNSIEKNGNHPVIRYPDYEIKKVLAEHGIKGNVDKVAESIQAGNRQAVFSPDGVMQYFAADPEYKDVFIYDKDLNLIYQNSQNINKSKTQQEANTGEQLSPVTNGLQNGVKGGEQPAIDKNTEPLLLNGTTNQSQDGNGKNQSKEKNQEVDNDKPLIEKGKRKKGANKEVTAKGEPPTKNAPPRGKAGEGSLLEKNGTSTKKGVGVK